MWRKVYESEPFDTTPLYRLSQEELKDALKELLDIAPLGEYGDGMDRFWGDLDPSDAPTHSSYRLSSIYEIVRSRLGHKEFGTPSLEAAYDLAAEHFQQYFIAAEDVLDQYFYPDTNGEFLGGGWSWLREDIGIRVQEKSFELQMAGQHEQWVAWYVRYPWRSCRKLSSLCKMKLIPLNSLDWHAANILRWARVITDNNWPALLKTPGAVGTIAHAGVEIGASYKAYILKRNNEIDALRGKETIASARKGGKARKKQYGPNTEIRLKTMKEYVENGHSISRAAELTEKQAGLGTAASNKKLWNRHK